jgi:sugar-phosphatase
MNGPPLLSRPAAVIFDMDGVLVNSEPLWRAAEIKVYARYGVFLTDEECRQTKGLRIDRVTALRLGHLSPARQYEANREVVKEMAYYIRNLKPDKDLLAVLDFLQAQGIRLALCTSSPPLLIKATERVLGRTFPVAVSAWRMKYPKPHPACYLKTLSKLGLPPEKCWCIEDSFSGMISALAAGIPTLLMPDPTEGPQPWHGAASRVVRSWHEVLECLTNLL